MTSPKPGISNRMISRIASGVTSRSATPVPPVVRIKPHPCPEKLRIVSEFAFCHRARSPRPKHPSHVFRQLLLQPATEIFILPAAGAIGNGDDTDFDRVGSVAVSEY
jgi:hypothetical protein